MRTLKFRAWDIDNKKYEYDIAIRPINRIIGIEIFNNEMYPVEFRGIVEQYIGLKDKNGKEIYEGDIVALLFGYVPMKSVTTENIRIENAQKAVIHFDTARAAFRYTIKQRTPKDCQFKPGTNTNMVVIGNVHENPELLGGEE